MANINNPLRPDNDIFVTPKADNGLVAAMGMLPQLQLTQGQEDMLVASIDANYSIDRALELMGISLDAASGGVERRKVLMYNIFALQKQVADRQFPSRPIGPGNPEQVLVNLDHLIELLNLLVKYREEIIYWVEEDGEKYLNYRSDFDAIARGVEIINIALQYGRKK